MLDGRYRVVAVIGSGGMGRVYRGEHTGIGRPVAIKVLHADLGRNREAVTRFQREAIASGRLDHPNIVTVTDSGFLDGVGLYLVMEALDGEPLGTRIERGRMPWGEALVVLSGVLAGLRHAHDRGVVHRDIKPDNIFLARKDGATVVKLLDFGIAKLYAGDANDPATTRAGLTVGTPAYLSPEQAVGGEITPASDLYSTTCVLFEMLTGRAPFEGKDPLSLLTAHVSRPPPRLAEAAPGLEFPEALEQLVAHGLQKALARALRLGERVPEERAGHPRHRGARLDRAWIAAGDRGAGRDRGDHGPGRRCSPVDDRAGDGADRRRAPAAFDHDNAEPVEPVARDVEPDARRLAGRLRRAGAEAMVGARDLLALGDRRDRWHRGGDHVARLGRRRDHGQRRRRQGDRPMPTEARKATPERAPHVDALHPTTAPPPRGADAHGGPDRATATNRPRASMTRRRVTRR